ncbi:MAG: amidohydrolase family protein [Paracoccaceae bacterium]|nr:amidohydrolase family protein [Paracoccaceae bacterium]
MAKLTWIDGATLVTLDADQTVIQEGDIWFDRDRIVAVGKKGSFTPEEGTKVTRVDGARRVVMPGLVNGHVHSYGALLKGSVDAVPLDVFMINAIAGAGKRSARDAYISAMLGAIEMVSTGTTGCLDHCSHRPAHTPDALDAICQAYADVGMRAAVAPMFSDLPFVETLPFEEDRPDTHKLGFLPSDPVPHDAYFEIVAEAVSRWKDNSLVTIMLGADSPQRCSDALLRRAGAFCMDHGIGNHTHLLEARTQWAMSKQRDPRGFVAYLAECGLAGPLSSFAHFIWFTDEDLEHLVTAGTTVVHNPSSNLILGSGVQPLLKLTEAGVPVAFGSDGLNAGNAVMFEKTRLAALLHRVTETDSSRWLTAGPLLRMATVNGARLLGAEGQRGMLAVGQAADMVLLDQNALTMTPLGEPQTQLVHYETGAGVADVYVAGEQVIADGKPTRVDREAILEEAREIAARLVTDSSDLLEKAAALHPDILSMVKRVHAVDCGPCRIARL